MAEPYVESVMRVVSNACQRNGISESHFWHWLGNTRFKGDNGNLTPERAKQIKDDVEDLITEYKLSR